MRTDKRNVRIGIAAHDIGGRGAAVGEKHLDRPRASDHGVVRQDVAVRRALRPPVNGFDFKPKPDGTAKRASTPLARWLKIALCQFRPERRRGRCPWPHGEPVTNPHGSRRPLILSPSKDGLLTMRRKSLIIARPHPEEALSAVSKDAAGVSCFFRIRLIYLFALVTSERSTHLGRNGPLTLLGSFRKNCSFLQLWV